MNLALGLIETKGLVGAIEAADAMAKAADVKIVGKEKVSAALMVIKIVGEVAAVKSAVDAGSVAAQRVGQLVSAHVIPRPDNQIDMLITSEGKKHKKKKEHISNIKLNSTKVNVEEKTEPKPATIKQKIVKKTVQPKKVKKKVKAEKNKPKIIKKSTNASSVKIPSMEELETYNVHSLRKLARSFDSFPIKGREISKANRGSLLDYFREIK
jgi:microcompartment protein CcmL/EutN